MVEYIQWRSRLRSELSCSYPMFCLIEEDVSNNENGPSMQKRQTIIVNIYECIAPSYRPICKRYNWAKRLGFLNNRIFYIRCTYFALSLHVLYVDVTRYPPHNLWVYLFFLTHWAHILNIAYLTCSLICCMKFGEPDTSNNDIPMPDGGDEYYNYDNNNIINIDRSGKTIPRLVKVTWLLYSTTAPLSLAICTLYWIGVLAPTQSIEESMNYPCIMEHGVIGLIILFDGIACRVPVRAKHVVSLLAICTSYLLWSIVNYMLQLGNGEWGPSYDDDALYPVLNWHGESRHVAAIVSGFAIIVLCPAMFWGVWMMSLASFEQHSDNNNNSLHEEKNQCCYRGCCGRGMYVVYEGRRRPLLGNESTELSTGERTNNRYDTYYSEMPAGTLT